MHSHLAHLPPLGSRLLSPLRYPGAKRRLAHYIAQTLSLNAFRPSLYVEPFAGGASVALQLLAGDCVDRIGLVDIDPLVAAFWKTVFDDSEWLCAQVRSIEITLDRWKRFKARVPKSQRQRALACLFLNRTSFSGIMAPGAGPLGGWEQVSEYDLGCRFPREKLITRIEAAANLADRVEFVWNVSWRQALHLLRKTGRLTSETFIYLDPPFFNKADRLYTYYFEERDHELLRDSLVDLQVPWLLSYDSPARVEELYSTHNRRPTQVELLYSTARDGGISVAREAVLTNLDSLPTESRLWRKSAEWRAARSTSPRIGNLGSKARLKSLGVA